MSNFGTDTGVFNDMNVNSINALSTSRLPVYTVLPPAGQNVAGSMVFVITTPLPSQTPPTGTVWVHDGLVWKQLAYAV